MTETKYVVVGMVLCGVVLVAIAWGLIASYKRLLDENDRLRGYIADQDLEQVSGLAVMQARIDELQDYIHEYGTDWSNYYGQTETPTPAADQTEVLFNPYNYTEGIHAADDAAVGEDLADTAFLSGVQGSYGRGGRHARDEVS